MSLLPIETGTGNEILREKSVALKKKEIDKKLGKLLDSMRETMFASDGVGLAAPQIGKNIRVVVCCFNHSTSHELIVDMINPEILSHSEDTTVREEGCLSLPGKWGDVARYKSLTVKYLDRKGRECMLKLKDHNARIVQHEVDHINGVLFIDRVKEQMGM